MMTKKTLLLWTLILCACSPGITTPQTSPPTTDSLMTVEFPPNVTTKIPSGPKIIVTVGTPNIAQGPDGNFHMTESISDTCVFVWAHPTLKELTEIFESDIKDINPKASGRATSFGEDCVYPDGRKVFFGIETDFYINLPATDLTNFTSFGNWIAETMPIAISMPPELIEGSQVGFVEYRFTKNESEQLIVRVPINTYNNSAQGNTGQELFLLFYTK